MNESNSDIACARSRCTPHSVTGHRTQKTKRGVEKFITPISGELSNSPDRESAPKVEALEEAERRWPGIIVLTERQLDDELGVAVYFTFPGGKYMAVWFSGTDELGVVSEDRPEWDAFVSTPD